MFINRQTELEALNERWNSKKAEFMVLYGRRRIGKTELIDYFIQQREGIRLLARIESEKIQLERFSNDLADYFSDNFLKSNPFQNWDSFFSYLAEKTKDKKYVIAIDEFPYLIDANKSITSILQDHWDRYLKKTMMLLILCGSSIAMMTEKVLGHKSPLYGRRTGQLKIEPMSFSESSKFFKNFKINEMVYVYSIVGGTPGYLLELDDKQSISENIKNKFLRKDMFLFQDAEFALKEELKEPKFYFSILDAISRGKTKIGEIMNEAGLDKGIVSKYLSTLIELDMVKREVPVTEKHKHKSRKGIYLLKDNFYKFWFNYVFPNIEQIEQKKSEYVLKEKITPTLDIYTSFIFEDVCKEVLWKSDIFHFDMVGSWWDKEDQIDIVALGAGKILFGECKWQENVNARKLLDSLVEKAEHVDWDNNTREEHYALFAKSFTNKIKEKNVFLFELLDIAKILK